tara:strand:+ start:1583 stop:2272 length:690 start_codon:yes stop_codon:yes gene_type:complete
MSTYLELCQDMARDIGIPGTGPSSITPTAEEEKDVVRYIKDADRDIQNTWFNWDFLWAEYSTTTSSGTSTITSPSDLAQWNIDSVVYDPTAENWQPLEFVPWKNYREDYKYGTVDSAVPEVFSIKPSNVMDLYPTPDASTTLTAEYWQTPTDLSADGSVSAIPVRYHRIIICRAKMFYAEQNDAAEVMAGSVSEFNDLLLKLEADQLPGQRNRRFSLVQNLKDYTVVPE